MRSLPLIVFVAFAASAVAQAPPPPPSAPSIEHDREMRVRHVRGVAHDFQRWARIPVAFGGGGGALDGVVAAFAAEPRDGRGVMDVLRFNGGDWVHTYTLAESDGVVVIDGASDQEDCLVRAVVSGLDPEDVLVVGSQDPDACISTEDEIIPLAEPTVGHPDR